MPLDPHRCAREHANHTHMPTLSIEFSPKQGWNPVNHSSRQVTKASLPNMGALQGKRAIIFSFIQPVDVHMHWRKEMTQQVPTKVFLKLYPDKATLSLQTKPCCLHPLGAPTHLPLSTLSAHTEPISKGHSQKWHYKAECLMLSIDGYIRLIDSLSDYACLRPVLIWADRCIIRLTG